MTAARGGALVVAGVLTACAPSPRVGVAPSVSLAPIASSVVEVAVTVDDLPIHGPAFAGVDRVGIARKLVAAFQAHQLPPVYGFVNAKKVDDDPSTEGVLRVWLAAGQPLGNHTYSHPSLNDTQLSDYLADIDRGEALLQSLEPDVASWKVFRYPFLFEGDTLEKREAVRAHLRQRGYVTAEVSIDGDDWAWNAPFARCSDRHDAARLAELRRGYVDTQVAELRYMRSVTRDLAGHEVKQVLLLHIGAADADAIDELLTAYEREGVRWVDLRAALADPFYSFDPQRPWRAGAAFPYAVARARGVTLPPAPPRDAEEKLETMCR
jgi:peptidoglycan/xylan/chitin deacetylase (PgdA/CDA1 family)